MEKKKTTSEVNINPASVDAGVNQVYYDRFKKNLGQFLDKVESADLLTEINKINDDYQDSQKVDFDELSDLETAMKVLKSLKSLTGWDEILQKLANKKISKKLNFDLYKIVNTADQRFGSQSNVSGAISNLSGAIDRLAIMSSQPTESTNTSMKGHVDSHRELMAKVGVDISSSGK